MRGPQRALLFDRLQGRFQYLLPPILRSNSAIRVSSARFWPTPGNARSPNLATSRLKRYSCRLTSRLRATKLAGSPARNRCTASSLNSLVNFLRDVPIQFPLALHFRA